MFLFENGIGIAFKDLAEKHFGELKIGIIKKIDDNAKLKGISANLFNDLKKNNYKLLKKIIVGKPNDLKNVINYIERGITQRRYPKISVLKKNKIVLTPFGMKIKNTFSYSGFIRKSNKWGAYEMADLIGIDVCAYCNRNYTFTLANDQEKSVRPEFDHFFTKSKYPYLALSFYNLIPSCHICNSNLKLTTEFKLNDSIHPYIASIDTVAKFSVVFKKKSALSKITSFGLPFFYGDIDSFDLKLISRTSSKPTDFLRVKKNMSTFKIEELYEKHKDMVIEMIHNAIIYDDSYINSMLITFGGTLFKNREDVLRHITKNYVLEIDLPKRPFSKLSKDIHTEFGLKF